jgi:hypothetical protein
MICLNFIILEPQGSRSVASSINGRLSCLLSLPDAGWGFLKTIKIQLVNKLALGRQSERRFVRDQGRG